jgi:hypothetical protein
LDCVMHVIFFLLCCANWHLFSPFRAIHWISLQSKDLKHF